MEHACADFLWRGGGGFVRVIKCCEHQPAGPFRTSSRALYRLKSECSPKQIRRCETHSLYVREPALYFVLHGSHDFNSESHFCVPSFQAFLMPPTLALSCDPRCRIRLRDRYFVGILSKLLSLVSLDRPGVEVRPSRRSVLGCALARLFWTV